MSRKAVALSEKLGSTYVKLTWVILTVLLLSTLLSGCQQQSETINPEDINSVRFAQVAGDVSFSKDSAGEWFQAVQGMRLELNNVLATGPVSEADLDVDDNKHILVGEDVRMLLKELVLEVGKSKVVALKVDTGAIYVRIQKKLNQGDSFEITTPSCIMGVRGTSFVVAVDGGSTVVSVLQGQVDGSTLNGIPLTVKEGEQLHVPYGADTLEKTWKEPIKLETLPPFVLNHLVTDHKGLPPIYSQPLDTAIAVSTDAAANRIYNPGGRIVDSKTGNVYARFDDALSYAEAQKACEARGGHLMTIGNEREQAIAEKLIYQGSKFFYLVGLSQKSGSSEPAQGFEWITGEPLTFERWHRENGAQVEPNNSANGNLPETHVTLANVGLWPAGDWNDQNLQVIKGLYGYLCEWDSLDILKTLESDPVEGQR